MTPAAAPDPTLRAHEPLVHKIVGSFLRRVPTSIHRDDLLQAARIGCSHAVARYDPSEGATFDTFATRHIRGAIQDELRSEDWMSRGRRGGYAATEKARAKLEQKLLRSPTLGEIAAALAISVDKAGAAMANGEGGPVHLDAYDGDDDEEVLECHFSDPALDPVEIIDAMQWRAKITAAMLVLPDRLSGIMRMIYENDMNQTDIGAVYGITASRVSQLRDDAIACMRATLLAA